MAFRLVLVERAVEQPLEVGLLLIALVRCVAGRIRVAQKRGPALAHPGHLRSDSLANLHLEAKDCPAFSNEGQYLDWAAGLIAAAARAKQHAVVSEAGLPGLNNLHHPVLANVIPPAEWPPHFTWAEVLVPVRLASGELRAILLGRRRGWRRYLSDDLDAFARTAAEIVEKVESLRRQELSSLVSQAELRAL